MKERISTSVWYRITQMPLLRSTLAAATVSSIVVVSTGKAQTSCDALMKFGIYDQFQQSTVSTQFEQFKAWVCSSNFVTYGQAKQEAQDLGLGIPDIFSFSFGGKTAEQDWGTWKSAFCQSDFLQIQNNYELITKIKVVSPALMTAVGKCLDNLADGKMWGWIETSHDETQFTFHARYRPVGSEVATISSFDVIPTSLRCTNLRLFQPRKTIHNAGIVSTCVRDPHITVTVNLNTSQGTASPTLDGVPVPLPVPPIPTINSFTVNPATITAGQPATLTWDVANSGGVTIDQNIGQVAATGTRQVSPESTTAYTVTAVGTGGNAQKVVVLNVLSPIPVINSFQASPATADFNSPITLS